MNESQNIINAALDELSANSVRFTELLDRYSEEELNRRVDEDGWSVGQHIQHITRAGRQFALAMKVTVSDARKREILSDGPFGFDLRGRLFLKVLEPPVKARVKSPKPARPEEFVELETLKAELQKTRKKLTEVYQSSAGIDMRRVKMRHPLNRLMNFNFVSWLSIVPSHERRHLWHIDNTLVKLGLIQEESVSG